MAGSPEYWLVDPTGQKVTVFVHDGDRNRYRVHGEYEPGQRATSPTPAGFGVDVQALFDRGS